MPISAKWSNLNITTTTTTLWPWVYLAPLWRYGASKTWQYTHTERRTHTTTDRTTNLISASNVHLRLHWAEIKICMLNLNARDVKFWIHCVVKTLCIAKLIVRPVWRNCCCCCWVRPRDVCDRDSARPRPLRDCSNARAARCRRSRSIAARWGHSADVSNTWSTQNTLTYLLT